jgi:hypothetical protein
VALRLPDHSHEYRCAYERRCGDDADVDEWEQP